MGGGRYRVEKLKKVGNLRLWGEAKSREGMTEFWGKKRIQINGGLIDEGSKKIEWEVVEWNQQGMVEEILKVEKKRRDSQHRVKRKRNNTMIESSVS